MKMVYVNFYTNISDMTDVTTILSLTYVEKNADQSASWEFPSIKATREAQMAQKKCSFLNVGNFSDGYASISKGHYQQLSRK